MRFGISADEDNTICRIKIKAVVYFVLNSVNNIFMLEFRGRLGSKYMIWFIV